MSSRFFEQLNILFQCRKYGVPFFQCPQLLFLLMGAVIIITTILSYYIGSRYIEDPLLVTLIVLLLSMFLLIVSFFVTRSFEKLAEVARIKSEFVSIVSHQLRSPLSNLRWATELLVSGKLGEIKKEQSKYFNILKQNTKRMTKILKDLLIVSGIESKNFLSKKEEIFLPGLIKKIISKVKKRKMTSNVEINFQFTEDLPKIYTDASQIELVIENLISNAVQYREEGKKGKVDIKVEKKRKKIYFEIKDNGIGIESQEQKYIFQKFFRTKKARKYQSLGTGLGLYISKEIIEKLNGKIGFKSQKNKGSIFWFRLPIK